jgi:hypothetical protein
LQAEKDYIEKQNKAIRLAQSVTKHIEDDKFDDNFGWANNGTMGHYIEVLQDLHDMMYGEGEYADQ